MLQEFADWLSHTSLSALFTDTNRFEMWLLVPVSQTVHTLAIGFVLIAVGVLNLRMLGVVATGQSYAKLSNQLMPYVWVSLVALLVTGVLQTIAEPSREIMNTLFRLKVIGLITVIAITYVFSARVKSDPTYWEQSGSHQSLGRVLAAIALALWIGIAVAGRLIAYMGTIES
jgi:hypothetical protein